MKKSLILVLLALAVFLTACGGSKEPAAEAPKSDAPASPVEETESIPEESGMDLSIYPSSNIAAFEANGAELFTYDQLFARMQNSFVEPVEKDAGGLSEYYKDAKGNTLLRLQGGEYSNASFYEYYEDGTLKAVFYTGGTGDAPAYQVEEYDINGQLVRSAYKASRGGMEFISNTIYDYHANGVIARENSYDGNVLHRAVTYNESGSELSWVYYYEDGTEDSRTDYAYDTEGKLVNEVYYSDGVMDSWMVYEYDTNGNNVKINEYSQYFPADVVCRYSCMEYYDNGTVKYKAEYFIDEGRYFGYTGNEGEMVYYLWRENEYYEDGNYKKEVIYDSAYMENGEYADYYMYEYDQYGVATLTYFDSNGNILQQITG